MPAHQVIINRQGNVLTVNQPSVKLAAQDWIQWVFLDLGANETPLIRFDSPANQPLGPFQFLDTSRSEILGVGNTGQTNQYSYTALVLNDTSIAAAADAPSMVVNNSEVVNPSPFATIQFQEALSAQLTPKHLQVAVSGTAVWTIKGLPEDHIVTFHFDVGDAVNGPFESLAMSQGSDGVHIATGIGLKDQGPAPNLVNYSVVLRRLDNSIVHEIDPVIEPLGWPPPPGSPAVP
jgi:hypothetical protein